MVLINSSENAVYFSYAVFRSTVGFFSPLSSIENVSSAGVTCIGKTHFILQEHMPLIFIKNVFKIAIMNEVQIPWLHLLH